MLVPRSVLRNAWRVLYAHLAFLSVANEALAQGAGVSAEDGDEGIIAENDQEETAASKPGEVDDNPWNLPPPPEGTWIGRFIEFAQENPLWGFVYGAILICVPGFFIFVGLNWSEIKAEMDDIKKDMMPQESKARPKGGKSRLVSRKKGTAEELARLRKR
eukprot:Clim_evm5s223 gene=Clim_evmTU5s223